jgi:hypothetical protein
MPVCSADAKHFEASAGCGGQQRSGLFDGVGNDFDMHLAGGRGSATTSPTADPPHGLSEGTVLFETLPALDLQLGL